MREEMSQEQAEVKKKKIHSLKKWKIWRVGHFRSVIEGARENQDP